MPGLLDDTRAIGDWIAGLSLDSYVNVMDQYRPDHKVGTVERYDPSTAPSPDEFHAGMSAARDGGSIDVGGRSVSCVDDRPRRW